MNRLEEEIGEHIMGPAVDHHEALLRRTLVLVVLYLSFVLNHKDTKNTKRH